MTFFTKSDSRGRLFVPAIGLLFCLCMIIGLYLAVSKLFTPDKAIAYYKPHATASYMADTDNCALCHRVHDAQGEGLVFYRNESLLCFTCHDGSGASGSPTARVQFIRDFAHTVAGTSTAYTKDCSSCHESHTDVTAANRLIDPRQTTASWETLTDVDDPDYDNSSPPSGVYMWCETCHQSSADTGTLIEPSTLPYVPFEVRVEWRTSKSPTSSLPGVTDNGNNTGYWDYFRASAYNDPAAATGEWHGRASSTALTVSAPYSAPYPAMPCTDCHSKHGSYQPWMLRDEISTGASLITGYDMSTMGYTGQFMFCTGCHERTNCTVSVDAQLCTDCHRHGSLF